ncbi:MAG: DUF177 domain-containing protein [Nitrospirota bacterium]
MALPSLRIPDIPEEGLTLDCGVLPEELPLAPDDARVRGELALSVAIAKAGQRISVTGVLGGTFVRQCVRCLREFEEPVSIPFAVEYRREEPLRGPQSQPSRTAGRAAEPAETAEEVVDHDETDVYPLVGDQLELGEMLREQVILAEPMQPLCRVACRGLCPICGQDLNERPCACPEVRQASPFAVLKQLRAGKARQGS